MNWDLIEKIANDLGVPYWTRKKWRQRDHVPFKWRYEIIDASKGKITQNTFLRHDEKKRKALI